MVRELTKLLKEQISDKPTVSAIKKPIPAPVVNKKPSNLPTKEYNISPVKIEKKPKIDTQELVDQPQNIDPEPEFLDNSAKLAARTDKQRTYFPNTDTMNAFKDSVRKQMNPQQFGQAYKANVDLLANKPIRKEEPSPQRAKLQALGILPNRSSK